MQDYSIYLVARSGRLVREIEVECVSDDAAIDLAQQWLDDQDVELWQLDRMIARFNRPANEPRPRPSFGAAPAG